MENIEKILEKFLNEYTDDLNYWNSLDEDKKQKWIEYIKYGDMYIPLYDKSNPFPQPEI